MSFDATYTSLANIDWRGSWLAIPLSLVLCALAFWSLWKGWRLSAVPSSILFDQFSAGILIALAFPLLVLERKFANIPERICRKRVFLAGFYACHCSVSWHSEFRARCAGLLCRAGHRRAQRCPDRGTGGCRILFARAGVLFVPMPPLEHRRSHADSLVVGLLRLERPSFTAMSVSVTRRFGIDLSRSWALGFIRRAAVPAVIGLAIFGWLLTGVTALDISQRAVYEAFGRPQAVFHSGLHVYLPWPFGRLRPLEYGAVREIPHLSAEDGTPPEAEPTTASRGDPIEGVPPISADRLWDASHPSEASYLVASNHNGRAISRSSILIYGSYRIGLSDQAAFNATYNINSPDTFIRAAAGRMLARYFARYTIPMCSVKTGRSSFVTFRGSFKQD